MKFAIFLFFFGLFLFITAPAHGDHLTYLPGVPNTPLMQKVIQTQEQTWCTDARTAAYPNFVSQLTDVNDQYRERVGINHRFIAGTYESATAARNAGCIVWHTMPYNIVCDGWAARIYYANLTVEVQYCASLGYTDFRSAHGHELGHGLLGLHEQYRDSGGYIGCTGRQDTVMDCGSGVRYPTVRDINLGCAIIATAWCGNAPEPPPPPSCKGETDPSWGGYWDNCIERWVSADGQWHFNPANGEWTDSNGVSIWCCHQPYGGVYNRMEDYWQWNVPTTIWRWRSDTGWRCEEGCP